MKKVANTLLMFVALFFFCYGLGAFFLPKIIPEIEIALALSELIAGLASATILILDKLGAFRGEEPRGQNSDILDDIDIED